MRSAAILLIMGRLLSSGSFAEGQQIVQVSYQVEELSDALLARYSSSPTDSLKRKAAEFLLAVRGQDYVCS